MPTTNTERMKQIADDLRADGAYTSANSVDALAAERDALIAALRPFIAIEDRAAFSYGQVWDSDIKEARKLVERFDNEAAA